MRKILATVILIAGFLQAVHAQQMPFPDTYLVNPASLAPSFTGKTYPFQAYVTYRSEWTGITGAPMLGNIYLDGKLGKKMGIGGSFQMSKAGIYRNFTINLDYAYHLQVARDHFIGFGLNGTFYQNSVDLSDLVVSDPYDPMIYNKDKSTESYFNVGASLLYNWKDFNFCLAFPMIINTKSLYMDTLYDNVLIMNRNFLVYSNYTAGLGEGWKMKFDLLFRKGLSMPWTFDAGVTVMYDDSYWAGVLYRKNNIFGVSAGLAIIHTILLNYTYEFSGSAMGGKSGGTHEITLGCRIGSPSTKTTKATLQIKEYDR